MNEVPARALNWTLIAIAGATAIAIADGVSDPYVLVGLLALPPILASATTSPRATGLVAAYCVALALASTLWNETIDGDYLIRLMLVSLAAVLGYWSALMRDELGAAARGAAVLAGGVGRFDNVLEERATVERLVAAVVPELGNVAIVDLLNEDGRIRVAAMTGSDEAISGVLHATRQQIGIDPNSDVPVARVIRSGETLVQHRMRDKDWRQMATSDDHLAMLREIRPRSMAVVPLRARGEVFAALSLESMESDSRYGEAEIGFAEELASRAANGIINARMHEREAHFARTLQESLLPRALPQIDGLEVAAAFRPVGPHVEVGGDFYDVFQLGPASWAAVIGDVCGKGPEAAALTSLMRDTLRASALRGEEPRETLSLLNAAIIEAKVDPGRFCTSAYVRFELGSPARLVVCNGGHPAPLVLRDGGEVEPIGPPGTLLGVFPDPDLVDTSTGLDRKELVMLYTDGLFEAPKQQGAGELDVKGLLAECRGMTAAQAVAQVEQRVLAAHQGQPGDDIAVMILRRL